MSSETQKELNVDKKQQTRIIPLVRRQGKEAVPARYKNRPALIRAWLHRAWVIAEEHGLTRGTLAVLQAIIASGLSTTNPHNHIFTKRSTLARLAQVGEATVYRALIRFEAMGLIDRIPQHRLLDGSLYIAELAITDKFAELFGIEKNSLKEEETIENNKQEQPAISHQVAKKEELPRPVSSSRFDDLEEIPDTCLHDSSSGEPLPTAAKMIDGAIGNSVYEEQSFEPKASVSHQFAAAPFVRRDGRTVPQELLWLIDEKRLTFGGLFKLMALAKQVPGQKLSDFVQLRSERLRQLPTHQDCYRYLNNLISQGIDARYLCKEQEKRANQERIRAQEKILNEARNHWIRSKHGQVFQDQKTGQTYQIDADYNLVRRGDSRPNIAINERFVQAVKSGQLIPYIQKIEIPPIEKRREILRNLSLMLKTGRSNTPSPLTN